MLRTFLGGLAVLAASITSALGHRMPEAEVTIERTEINKVAKSAFTVRLHAEDALKILSLDRELNVDLDDGDLHQALANRLAMKITLDEGALTYFGGSVDGNSVYIFFTGDPSVRIESASMLSSIHPQWTNRINDMRRGAVATQVFTQGGELKGHRH